MIITKILISLSNNMIIDTKTAANIIQQGGIVAIPTETVYGLAAQYNNPSAVNKIYQLKARPLDHPLILHIGQKHWLEKYAINIPDYVYPLIEKYWPGPLTIVLDKNENIGEFITANQQTIAIRMPSHKKILELLNILNEPLVAPSANKFCKTSPTSAAHVVNNFGDDLPIIDGGKCDIGIESTIILATQTNAVTLLRPGIISQTEIESVIDLPCNTYKSNIKVPGNLKLHYQPDIPLYAFDDYTQLSDAAKDNKKYFCMFINDYELPKNNTILKMPDRPIDYANMLYDTWQAIDTNQYDAILIELPPNSISWAGIRDRIFKASKLI